MSIENEIQDLTQSTTDLLNAVNTKKVTLDNAVTTAEAAKTVATSKAAEATTVVADASTHATNAANSASQAAASAASANQIVTGVATGLPNIRPSLNLDFVNSKRVDPRIDFTRSTTATYYDGKTVAKAEENLVTASNGLDVDWATNTVNRTTNAGVAPDGTTTATKLQATSTGFHFVKKSHASIPANTSTALSVYAKADTGSFVQIMEGYNANVYANFDLTTGTVGSVGSQCTARMVDVGNGWYRCIVEHTGVSNANSSLFIRVIASSTDGRYTSTTLGDSIYAWGAQVEQRSTATAYTPTTGSPITNYIPVLKTAAINEPRLDHDPVTGEAKGLLMEESRTNTFLYSDLSTGIVVQSGDRQFITHPSPIGLGSCVVLKYSGSTTYVYASNTAPSGNVVFSAYVKDLGGSEVLTSDIVPVVANSQRSWDGKEYVGNGWYRLWCHEDLLTGGAYTGLLMNSGDTKTLISTGWQLEAGSFPTSYIPTDGTAVTRSGDIASISAETLNYHPTEGTIVFDGKSGYPHGIPVSRYAFVVNGINPNDLFLYRHGGGGAYRLGGGGISMYFNDEDISAHHRHVVSYNGNNDLVYYTETGLVSSDTSVILPTNVTEINLGQTASNTAQYSGWIKGFSYYPQRITNTEAEALAATV